MIKRFEWHRRDGNIEAIDDRTDQIDNSTPPSSDDLLLAIRSRICQRMSKTWISKTRVIECLFSSTGCTRESFEKICMG